MFWTDAIVRQLIEARYPDFLVLWDNNRNNINKADALRYFVLYEFGGIYADLDFECFRPLDPVTRKYAAIFPLEPFEHSTFRLKIPFLLNNAIMMSRPRHPFLKFMIDNLMAFQMQLEQLGVAGPCFVTTNFVLYNNLKEDDLYNLSATPDGMSPYFYKGSMDETDENAVYVPNTHFFMNTLSTSGLNEQYFTETCFHLSPDSSTLLKRGCNELRRRKSRDSESHFRFTFTMHHWSETYSPSWTKVEHTYTNIRSIIPASILQIYSELN
ncbi:hypothetical protein DPMN_080746 [Dreissena polymorpha]|uniref:Glycosyltransferase n=1 Tax=Dreissena polymorpha TaxID=45954 RepID=A0A9D3YVS0_DREPO|nr:hypothetical protein DPMN_080746 [Dreissena polymorpha]